MTWHRKSYLRVVGQLGTGISVVLTAHTLYNLRRFRRPEPVSLYHPEHISVLLPVRDEADRIEPCLLGLLNQHDGGMVEYRILDDASTDDTVAVVARVLGDDPRFTLDTEHSEPPVGWLGKTWACQRLTELANPASTVLVFIDADVVLEPDALIRAVATLRAHDLDLVCPYPRQIAITWAERLLQPLLQWSFLTTLPLRVAESSRQPSLTAANGQFLVADRATFDRAGGYGAVRGDVLDDVALARAIKSAGGRGGVIDGTPLATCRMYRSTAEVRAGYRKSLWSAFGSPAGAAIVNTMLLLAYVAPPVSALVTADRWATLGAAAGVTGRIAVARRVQSRIWPDVITHPLAIAAFACLVADSWIGHRSGSLTWRGRLLGPTR